jgi:DNA-directed RNA polymerase specialized sigma24 family protein
MTTETSQTCAQAQASSESPSQKNQKAVFQITCSNCGTVQQMTAESAPPRLSRCRYCPNPAEDEARRGELAFDRPAPEQNIHRLGMKKRQPRADRQALKEFSAGMRKLQKLSPGEWAALVARERRALELDAAVPTARLIDDREIGLCLSVEERAAVRLLVIERKSYREVEAATGISRGNVAAKVNQCLEKLAKRGREKLDRIYETIEERGIIEFELPPALAGFADALEKLEPAPAYLDDEPNQNVTFNELTGPSERARRRDDYKNSADDYSESGTA